MSAQDPVSGVCWFEGWGMGDAKFLSIGFQFRKCQCERRAHGTRHEEL
jgi:hypothetical protein